jgi:hypothetical protein
VKLKDILSNTQQHIVHVMLDLRTGTYQCKFALSSCAPGYPSLNSARFEIALQ